MRLLTIHFLFFCLLQNNFHCLESHGGGILLTSWPHFYFYNKDCWSTLLASFETMVKILGSSKSGFKFYFLNCVILGKFLKLCKLSFLILLLRKGSLPDKHRSQCYDNYFWEKKELLFEGPLLRRQETSFKSVAVIHGLGQDVRSFRIRSCWTTNPLSFW